MLNFSRTPTRLDTSPSLQKMIFIFCMFWIVIFAIYAFPTTSASKANQAHISSEYDMVSISLQEGEPWFSTDKCHAKVVEKAMEFSNMSETLSIAKEIIDRMLVPIPMQLYLHPENDLSSEFHWVPMVVEEAISEDDILVDLASVLNPELSYELSAYYEHIVDLIVERESGNQPFLGQLLVAEDVVSRIRSGLYGSDIDAILMRYLAERRSDGKLHIYLGSKEILEASPSVQEAVELALSGSQVSYYLLKATTELRNEQYDLQLDDIYYKWGALYHFAPKRIRNDPIAVRNRRFSRVPVSFQYYGHIFYGHWD